MSDKIDEAFGAWCEATFGEAITTTEYRFLKDGYRAGYVRAVEDAAKCVPTNWVDHLLTGPEANMKNCDCREIERLLRGVQDRIRAIAAPKAEEGK